MRNEKDTAFWLLEHTKFSTKVDTLSIEIEKYNMDVLSEIKKKGSGIKILGQYIHLCSGVKKHQRAKALECQWSYKMR